VSDPDVETLLEELKKQQELVSKACFSFLCKLSLSRGHREFTFYLSVYHCGEIPRNFYQECEKAEFLGLPGPEISVEFLMVLLPPTLLLLLFVIVQVVI